MAEEIKQVVVDNSPVNLVIADTPIPSNEPTIVAVGDGDNKTTIDNVEYSINKDGDAVNSDNKVIFTKAQIEEQRTSTNVEKEVEIDEVKYKLDDAGNALDKEGKVFKTKEELEKLAEINDVPLIEDIQKRLGIVVTDDKGQAIIYENNDEGLVKYVTDAVALRAEELYNKAASEFFEANPDILDIFKFKQLNGSVDNYKPAEDYNKITFKKDNPDDVQTQIDLIVKERLAKGDTLEQANRFAQYSKTDGKLFDDAVAAKKYLVDSKATRDLKVNEELKAKRDAAEQNKQQELDNVYNKVVKEGKLTVKGKTYTLPKNIRTKVGDGKYETKSQEDFFNYLYLPVAIKLPNGQVTNMSKHQYDIFIEDEQKNIDDDLFAAYTRFVGGDMTQLIEEEIKKAEVKKFRTLRSNSFGTTSKQLSNTSGQDKFVFPVK